MNALKHAVQKDPKKHGTHGTHVLDLFVRSSRDAQPKIQAKSTHKSAVHCRACCLHSPGGFWMSANSANRNSFSTSPVVPVVDNMIYYDMYIICMYNIYIYIYLCIHVYNVYIICLLITGIQQNSALDLKASKTPGCDLRHFAIRRSENTQQGFV